MAEETTARGGGIWAAADLLTPMAVRVAATLRLADHIAAGTRTARALAEAVHADQDVLGRLLDHLVTAGVLSSTGEGAYDLTDMGGHLRDGEPEGMRSVLDIEGAIGHAELSLIHLLHTVRTGEPAFPQQYGLTFWEDLSADDGRAESFDALMGARLAAHAPAVATAYPWGSLRHVIDVGGGDGSMLIAILQAHGELRGTVLDLPGPVRRAGKAIAAAGLDHRADTVAGSFFDELPTGADGYLLSSILHNWDDASAARILRRCADAASTSTSASTSAGTGGSVLVVDYFTDQSVMTEGDLRMLCYFGGRQHSIEQLGELAGATGLKIASIMPAGRLSVVELRASG
ncbi:methyltransferase [Actinomadura sp. NEAU-AAG7]|uniref:methyltransferase n=1 Tax=Actinomadura sp. NEAU-AAG7 TaxID=2839640 RepID=UPI001BE46FE5|nr:methyltransferase [Actinomadura sp. NEAU-AAG7]MBT2206905.1 methyltransferase [Actinomadura sp. NEAU-AAG7]